MSVPTPPPAPPFNILFVCVGNACRSQMAEAVAKKMGGDRVRVWSAGSSPLGEVIPQTHDALREKGITLDGHWSKGLNEIPVKKMDIVVTMGREVYCPLPESFKGRLIAWNIPDPYGHGREYFRNVLELIEVKVKALLHEPEQHPPEASAKPLPPKGKVE